jgi:hypothetical protein
MNLLLSLGDLGIPDPLPAQIDARARSALQREIERSVGRRSGRRRSLRVLGRVLPVPVLLAATVAVAAAATAAVLITNPFQAAIQRNQYDSPLVLFERNPDVIGATPVSEWKQTVISSTVRDLGSFRLPGVGTIQYWAAQTRQHGICGGLRLANGNWVGLQGSGDQGGGKLPGCYPTRSQVGGGALIISGFDYIDAGIVGAQGQRWDLVYGKVDAGLTPSHVTDTISGRSASLLRGDYFAIAVHPVGNYWGDVHLKATNATGQTIADERKPLAGTPTVKCIGRYDVHRERIPGTHRYGTLWKCHSYKHVLAK